MDDALEEIDEALGPGVDDPGLGEHGELLGRVLERSRGPPCSDSDRSSAKSWVLWRSRVHRVGPVPDEGDHRPFDRGQDGPRGIGDRLLDGFGEVARRRPGARCQLAAEAVDILGEDEAGIAPGAVKGGLGDGSQGRLHGPRGDRPAGDGPHGRGQVGARIGVGDGEDVDLVEIVLVAG